MTCVHYRQISFEILQYSQWISWCVRRVLVLQSGAIQYFWEDDEVDNTSLCWDSPVEIPVGTYQIFPQFRVPSWMDECLRSAGAEIIPRIQLCRYSYLECGTPLLKNYIYLSYNLNVDYQYDFFIFFIFTNIILVWYINQIYLYYFILQNIISSLQVEMPILSY